MKDVRLWILPVVILVPLEPAGCESEQELLPLVTERLSVDIESGWGRLVVGTAPCVPGTVAVVAVFQLVLEVAGL